MKTGTKRAKKSLPRQYTLLELQDAVADRLVGALGHLRPPSMPTLKNMSRSGVLVKGGALVDAVATIIKHLQANEAYYSQGENLSELPGSGARAAGTQLSPQVADRILAELQGLGQRISNIENKIVMETRHREATIDPRLTQALDQLDATRKHVLNRLDAELQGIKPGGGRGFDTASAVDAARILAIVSQIKDVVLRWDSAGPSLA